MARYVVGIDLGTTNSVVAFTDTAPSKGRRKALRNAVEIFPVAQRVGPSATEARPLLPSSLYALLPGEGEGWIVGEHARLRGAEAPARVVASSKSWLSHAGVDRRAPILPWDVSGEGASKLSPIDAATAILRHVREAWDAAHPDETLARQDVVLTVPASFDEVARTLTMEAAREAGIAPKLLEEPQAAFLDWARREGDRGLARLLGDLDEREVLVCDVGGGTTDLSLVRVRRDAEAASGLSLVRAAVGDHLLLGGDNVDIALAHRLEGAFSDGGPETEKIDGVEVRRETRMSATRFAQLVLACRGAKESLLSSELSAAKVTLLGHGGRLVGGTRSETLTRTSLEEVLDGFFPLVEKEALAEARTRRRGGLLAFGLPYATDPAITRHIALFLDRHARAETPLALLLNGGVFHGKPIVDRLVAAIAAFTGKRPLVLPHGDPDLSVARGAVAHGLALRGIGQRIGGGSAHGYYVGVGERRAVCVVPRGAEPGEAHVVEGSRPGAAARTLSLVVGRSARFDLFSSDRHDRAGDVVDLDGEALLGPAEGGMRAHEFTALPPLVTAVGAGAGHGEVHVTLEGELSEVGTLDLRCVELGTSRPRSFRLGFELRTLATARGEGRPSAPPSRADDHRLREARARVDRIFGKAQVTVEPREVKSLVRDLERLLGDRPTWTRAVVRPLCDDLLANVGGRRRTADHERVFLQLAGFTLRPGFGDPLDAQRVSVFSPLFSQGLCFRDDATSHRAWWVAWRRVAGGLTEETQTLIRDTIDPFLAPDDGRPRRKPKNVRPEPFDELLFLVSSLERVPAARRAELGAWILDRTWTTTDPNLYAALGRLGSRVPSYASAHHVVSPRTAETWLAHLLRADWRQIATCPYAALQLARATGDRARDVSEPTRHDVARRLEQVGAKPEWIRAVREVVAIDEGQRREMFGEALPVGLRIVEEG